MGLTCNYEGKKMVDLGDQRRASYKSKSYNDNYNFIPIDNDNNNDDDDEKRDSKKDNVIIEKSKNNNNSKPNSKNNNQTKNKRNNSQKKNDNKSNPYLDFNNNSKYFIICPDCKNKVPSIKDTEYDTNRNDFIIEYFCNCIPNGDDKKSYLVNFISDKKPENVAYSFESLEKLKSMLDTVKDKQDEFQGFQILDKIYKELNILRKKMSFNKSMAPPANM